MTAPVPLTKIVRYACECASLAAWFYGLDLDTIPAPAPSRPRCDGVVDTCPTCGGRGRYRRHGFFWDCEDCSGASS